MSSRKRARKEVSGGSASSVQRLVEAAIARGFEGADAAPKELRGHLMHTALTTAIPLQARLEQFIALSPDRWTSPLLFDAMNPRAFIPVSAIAALLSALGKAAPLKTFRAWCDTISSSHTSDVERDRLMNHALHTLLSGNYVWIPAAAWFLERLSWDAIYALVVEAFGPNQNATPVANPNYRGIELAILRENLLRHHARLDEVWQEAFRGTQPGPEDELAASTAPLPPLALFVLRLAVAHATERWGQTCAEEWEDHERSEGVGAPPPMDTERAEKALRQGMLGQLLQWEPSASVSARLHAVLRIHQNDLPAWALMYLQVVA